MGAADGIGRNGGERGRGSWRLLGATAGGAAIRWEGGILAATYAG